MHHCIIRKTFGFQHNQKGSHLSLPGRSCQHVLDISSPLGVMDVHRAICTSQSALMIKARNLQVTLREAQPVWLSS